MILNDDKIKEFEEKAVSLRKDVVNMVYNAKSGHLGGSLSMIEILIALYFVIMKIDPDNPKWEDRDRFILSKGHTAPALYAVLAEKGYFDKKLLFNSYRKIDSILQGHPDIKSTPGVDMTAGSLGMGLSAACGMAWGSKLIKKNFYVYVMIGDGVSNEGQIWEAAMTAAHHRLERIIAFIDLNGMQNDGFTKDVMRVENMAKRWEAFGWKTFEVNGHDIQQILNAIDSAKKTIGKPSMIVCHTVKGKGISYMENSPDFHGGCPNEDQYKQAMKELR